MVAKAAWVIEQSEADFQIAVQEYATLRGWSWMHIQKAVNEREYWRTPVTGTLGKGFPDLLMVRDGRLVFIELKAAKGKLSPNQTHVLGLLGLTMAECYVWRPVDWPTILQTLA